MLKVPDGKKKVLVQTRLPKGKRGAAENVQSFLR